jgi:hypothetical protein
MTGLPDEGQMALDRVLYDTEALSATVLLIESGKGVRVIYHWPERWKINSALHRSGTPLERVAGLPRCVEAGSPLGALLSIVAPGAGSFLLFSSEARQTRAVVVFGFTDAVALRRAARAEVSAAANLVALATCSAHEAHRLRGELATVSERLGRRKLIERAKGLLQMEQGLSEREAYDHLRNVSRRRRISMGDAAELMLRSSS